MGLESSKDYESCTTSTVICKMWPLDLKSFHLTSDLTPNTIKMLVLSFIQDIACVSSCSYSFIGVGVGVIFGSLFLLL